MTLMGVGTVDYMSTACPRPVLLTPGTRLSTAFMLQVTIVGVNVRFKKIFF